MASKLSFKPLDLNGLILYLLEEVTALTVTPFSVNAPLPHDLCRKESLRRGTALLHARKGTRMFRVLAAAAGFDNGTIQAFNLALDFQ